ncbi:hypothetical protein [Actinoplanes awajinensis]|uniref:hypothetical protein n=1 Tax=Actinoplanes awajinensis TaxID=135946 RepID=UPI000A01253F|nr:hypothetical protein [Actinoplanes awajinensis]
MGDFLTTTLARVPDGFDLPEPLRLLFAWVDEQGFVPGGPRPKWDRRAVDVKVEQRTVPGDRLGTSLDRLP